MTKIEANRRVTQSWRDWFEGMSGDRGGARQGCQVDLCQVTVKGMLVGYAAHIMLAVAVVVVSASAMAVAAVGEVT